MSSATSSSCARSARARSSSCSAASCSHAASERPPEEPNDPDKDRSSIEMNWKRFVDAALVLTLLAGAARAQARSLDARVNLQASDRTVEDVVARLRMSSGANIVVVDP